MAAAIVTFRVSALYQLPVVAAEECDVRATTPYDVDGKEHQQPHVAA
jgi:hypothetical protein